MACAGESSGERNDSPVFREIHDPGMVHSGVLLADKAYDSVKNLRLCIRNNLTPVIKQRRHGAPPRGLRRKAARCYDPLLYKRYRGLVEGVFG